MFETLRLDVGEDGVAVLTLARPDQLNAANNKMLGEIVAACDQVDADDAIRALIVTSEGRAFCAGADLSRGADSFVDPGSGGIVRADGSLDYANPAARDTGGIVALRLFRLLKPVIAAINGPAVGVGMSMTLPMDIRIAADSAKFGFVFTARGVIPDATSSWFLPRLVGISRALEWCYGARMVSANEALAAGLVRSVVPAADLLGTARELAREFAERSAPVSAALTRQMLWRGLGMNDPMEAHRIESRGFAARGRAADVREGIAAWAEKRAPRFPDRVSIDMPDFFPWWDELPYA